MDDKTKEDFIQLFNQGFEEVVRPEIEELSQDIKKIDERLDHLEQRMDRMENTLDRVADKVTSHETRLKTIEVIPIVAHQIKK
jgi:predicted nuclease with TOPRIM domain